MQGPHGSPTGRLNLTASGARKKNNLKDFDATEIGQAKSIALTCRSETFVETFFGTFDKKFNCFSDGKSTTYDVGMDKEVFRQ